VPDSTAEAILAHTPPKMVRTYKHYQPVAEMRAALETWSVRLAEIVSGEPRSGVVVSFANRG
jgi:hypothetical protein